MLDGASVTLVMYSVAQWQTPYSQLRWPGPMYVQMYK